MNFGKRYENALMVIFDQWPKLYLGFDVEPEIRILKVIYFVSSIEPIGSFKPLIEEYNLITESECHFES